MPDSNDHNAIMPEFRDRFPEKFAAMDKVFALVRRGVRVFISTACGEPQYLVRSLVEYVKAHPKAIFDAEIIHVWTMGVAPYADEKIKENFRHNSFFIGNSTREAVNKGLADYTPIFLSTVPGLFRRGMVPIDVALIQTSPPDHSGMMSLGVSVDLVKAAVESASLVIAQVNRHMPRIHGDTFISIEDVDYIVPYDEPILEFESEESDEASEKIGKYVSRIVQDGDTIQVGYGSLPNAIISNLCAKKHLGVHTELLSDGIIELIRCGAVDNTMKTIDRGKVVATFCMGTRKTYDFLHDNPMVAFRTIDYTNNPLTIARLKNMTAINSALQIDLTGQATAESLGKYFYSGIGGQADFMRGAMLAPGGKTILALRSTADGNAVSRIVPVLDAGAGVTLNRGDVHYVVTEYGIAYIYGKNIRERAMDIIAIAHPDFRQWLIDEAKELGLIYRDQVFIPGEKGEYPEHLETYRNTRSGIDILLRAVKISDEPLLKDFFYSLSDTSVYRRFISGRMDMHHDRLQEFVVIDHSFQKLILAILRKDEAEIVVGMGQYSIIRNTHSAEIALVVRDDHQNQGIGSEILSYLVLLAKKDGLFSFSAEVLVENRPVLHLLEKSGFEIERNLGPGVYELKIRFSNEN
jgi:acyl-CoA hydrolase/RimJ/RimL family protein N-acetyltransferase